MDINQQISGFIIAGGTSLAVLHMVDMSPFYVPEYQKFLLTLTAAIGFLLAMIYMVKSLSLKPQSDNEMEGVK